jgi:hypothetical protein
VLEAGLWAALGQSALIVGALLVARFPKLTEPRWLGLVMALGAGALISAITTDLVVPAYHAAGRAPTGIGLLVGAVGYYGLTTWLNQRAEREDPEKPVEEADELGGAEALPSGADATTARNLTVGMVLDGIPESIAGGPRSSAAGRCRSRWWARCSCRTCPTPSGSRPRCWPVASSCARCCCASAPSCWSASSPVSPATPS